MTTQLNKILSRRQFSLLSILLGSSVLASPVLATRFSTAEGSTLYLSAASDSHDQHWLAGFKLENSQVQLNFKHRLPARAHHIAINQEQGVYVVVARRPGTYLVLGDLLTGEIIKTLSVPENRHLLGHGVFSKNGDYFYTTEADFENLQADNGRIGVWSLSKNNQELSLQRINEWGTYGIGPHELLLMPDQETLAVANGGIRTHPDTGREKLNLATMKPSLVYLKSKTGKLLEQHFLSEEIHQASIRHMDVNYQGMLALAMQYEGEPFNDIPLVMTHQIGESLQNLNIPLPDQQQMKQYVGSIKFDLSGRFLAASCPKGNRITFWDTQTKQYLASIPSRDGCGLGVSEQGFIVTSGTGRISHYDLANNEVKTIDNPLQETAQKVFWDNHLSVSV